MEESSLNFETDRQKTIGVRRRRLVGNESCVRRRGRVCCALEEWRSGVGIYIEMARVGGTGEAKVGGKVCTFNRFAAGTGQSRDEPECKQCV
jgi:hypothetical protein